MEFMVNLRKAEQSDMDLLFEWANDPAVRKNSFRSDPIPYADHVKWDGGYYSTNIGSGKAVMRAGYKEEGIRAGYCLLDDGTRADDILLGLTRDDYNQLDYSK